ncbi:MAG: hydroxymethylglutaryl-CoA lyase [Spirochaetales bacterium]|nr:hydroxymethylglutaryl-CoA lyase [Spirochaetales bacterium]
MSGKYKRYELPVRKVSIFEVGPRDGLQNEPELISTDDKIALTDMLTDAGCTRVEVTSFVHPKWVPQMADAEKVLAGIEKKPGVLYNALIPNMRGLERAIACGLDHVVTIMSASQSHNRKNLNMSVEASLKELENVISRARSAGVKVRSYIGTAYGCPMEGAVDPHRVLEIALALEHFGSYEISLGDTTGMAHPRSAFEVGSLVKGNLKDAALAAHFHRADGIEFANVLASLEAGIDIIDSAAGGLGGCPYAPGAKGNIATETLVDMLHRLGIRTGIDSEKIQSAGRFAKSLSAYYRDEAGHE